MTPSGVFLEVQVTEAYANFILPVVDNYQSINSILQVVKLNVATLSQFWLLNLKFCKQLLKEIG